MRELVLEHAIVSLIRILCEIRTANFMLESVGTSTRCRRLSCLPREPACILKNLGARRPLQYLIELLVLPVKFIAKALINEDCE